jgi:hypothetical protein
VADHNDPNAVNSIFSDIDVSAADIYDLFGYPSDDVADGEEKVVVALTFASVPAAGTFDPDLLYRIRMTSRPRLVPPTREHHSVPDVARYLTGLAASYFGNLDPAEVRATVDGNQALVSFQGFLDDGFAVTVPFNEVVELTTPGGHRVKAFLGGRDDAFFNDLPGFFRSINYAPQFYHVPHTMTDARELPIPKTLIELDGNHLFNYDPAKPTHGRGLKLPLPPGPYTWEGDSFAKDADGSFRFVYSGEDAQAGKNVNAVILELPLAMLTREPRHDRIVATWAESWVRKASDKAETIPDDPPLLLHPVSRLATVLKRDHELARFKLVDTVGQPFADAALNEREDDRQVGANNFHLGPHFIARLGHLGWGFGPSITALGLATSFDHDGASVSVHKTPNAVAAFPRVRKTLFQELRLPDESWRRNGVDVPLRTPFEVFVPNVCSIDMDTTGTWPFGRRPEDQVATRFLSLFLDMEASAGGRRYDVELLGDQALWDTVSITPKAPPNPLRNDVDFLAEFPYLAPPHE